MKFKALRAALMAGLVTTSAVAIGTAMVEDALANEAAQLGAMQVAQILTMANA